MLKSKRHMYRKSAIIFDKDKKPTNPIDQSEVDCGTSSPTKINKDKKQNPIDQSEIECGSSGPTKIKSYTKIKSQQTPYTRVRLNAAAAVQQR